MAQIILASILTPIYLGLFLAMIIIPIVTYEKYHKDNKKKGNKGVD